MQIFGQPPKAAIRVFQFVFPDTKNAPAESAQFAIHAAVTRSVVVELIQPEDASSRRESGVSRTAVPETSVNKDD